MRFFIIIYFLLITSLSLFSACQDEQLINQRMLSEEFFIEEGEVILLTTSVESESIEIKVLNIEDSRCPADVICIWGGNVKVTFTINQQEIAYLLCLGECGNGFNETDELEVQTDKGTFNIKLLEVAPYPRTGDDTPKEAKFLVTQ
ncbi:MAG: hypothetical protein ACNS60_04885 [Candidatus Cyclobacteriaceae bacterium M2_1C_046]